MSRTRTGSDGSCINSKSRSSWPTTGWRSRHGVPSRCGRRPARLQRRWRSPTPNGNPTAPALSVRRTRAAGQAGPAPVRAPGTARDRRADGRPRPDDRSGRASRSAWPPGRSSRCARRTSRRRPRHRIARGPPGRRPPPGDVLRLRRHRGPRRDRARRAGRTACTCGCCPALTRSPGPRWRARGRRPHRGRGRDTRAARAPGGSAPRGEHGRDRLPRARPERGVRGTGPVQLRDELRERPGHRATPVSRCCCSCAAERARLPTPSTAAVTSTTPTSRRRPPVPPRRSRRRGPRTGCGKVAGRAAARRGCAAGRTGGVVATCPTMCRRSRAGGSTCSTAAASARITTSVSRTVDRQELQPGRWDRAAASSSGSSACRANATVRAADRHHQPPPLTGMRPSCRRRRGRDRAHPAGPTRRRSRRRRPPGRSSPIAFAAGRRFPCRRS